MIKRKETHRGVVVFVSRHESFLIFALVWNDAAIDFSDSAKDTLSSETAFTEGEKEGKKEGWRDGDRRRFRRWHGDGKQENNREKVGF